MWAKSKGFTIVELLIVIVVIAILAAITIVAYNGIQQRARASEASAALSQAKKKLELYKVDNSAYPLSGTLGTAGITDSDVSYQYTSDGSTYCITGTVSNVSYKVTDTTSPTAGGCPGHGQGGIAAITNLVTNPSMESSSISPSSAYNGSVSFDTTTAVTGTKSLLVTASGPSYLGVIWRTPVSGSGTYRCSVSIKANFSRSISVALRAETSGGGYIAEGMGSNTVTPSSAWQRVSATANITNTTLGLLAIQYRVVDNNAVVAGEKIWGDAAICTTGSTSYNYADGDSTDWTWNSTPNNSTSTGLPL